MKKKRVFLFIQWYLYTISKTNSYKYILDGNENENENADTCDAKFQYGWIEIHNKN
jgi:hypothetical protein